MWRGDLESRVRHLKVSEKCESNRVATLSIPGPEETEKEKKKEEKKKENGHL